MYRIIEKKKLDKYNDYDSKYYIQKRNKLFWYYKLNPFFYHTLITIVLIVISIILLIKPIKSITFNLGAALIIATVVYYLVVLFITKQGKYNFRTKYDYYISVKTAIEELEKPTHKSETVIHYINPQHERADKLMKLKRKNWCSKIGLKYDTN